MKGQIGFETIVGIIWLLIVLGAIIFAYISVASEFPTLDPLSQLFVILMPISMLVGAVFIQINKETILRGP